MMFHELCTNAFKYGALSNDHGQVAVRWSVDPRNSSRFRLEWVEADGPPVTVPSKRGFGTRLIERALAAELNGKVEMDFRPGGVVCTLDAEIAEDARDAAATL